MTLTGARESIASFSRRAKLVLQKKIRFFVLEFNIIFSPFSHLKAYLFIVRWSKQNSFSKHLNEVAYSDEVSTELRKKIWEVLSVQRRDSAPINEEDLVLELEFLCKYAWILNPIFKNIRSRRVLYPGQCYYNAFYLSKGLVKKGWKASVLDWDLNQESKKYYHGSDFEFEDGDPYDFVRDVEFYLEAIYHFDLFHFSNMAGISFGKSNQWFSRKFRSHFEIYLLKKLGKKIVYTNNGCLDGVTKTSFGKWGPYSPCEQCVWKDFDTVCSDIKNAAWGKFRNEVADFQCLLGGNRADYNVSPTIHEVPEVFCLNPEVWNSEIIIPDEYLLPERRAKEVRLYHAVGNAALRTKDNGVNIKSTHIYLPLVEKLRHKGYDIELISPNGIPNIDVRYLQLQADIFLEMLTYGWFGANAREAMMLGKPVVCFLRPEWLSTLRDELPEYADELPIVSALPETVEAVLQNLIENKDLRQEIGRKSKEFALKWHSDTAAAERFDRIYSELLLDFSKEKL